MKRLPLVVVLALVCSPAALAQVASVFLIPDAPAAQVPQPARDVGRPATTGTAAIRGRVLTQAGTPLRRAQVMIFEGPLRRQTTTDADGRYAFAGLPAGRFNITASKAGYLGLQYGQKRPNQPGTPVIVASGQVVTSIDLTLPRGSVVTGRITDEFGEPLTQAQVQVQRLQYGPDGQRRAQTNQSSMTDDRGEFRAYGLMPGEYVINAGVRTPVSPTAANINDVAEGFPPIYYPGTANAEQAQPITLAVGEEVSIQFSLIPARLGRVSGIVVDSAGRPASGAQLQLSTRQGAGQATFGGGTVAADGTFSFGGVPPGEHSIEVRPNMRFGASAVVTPGSSGEVFVASATGEEFASLPIVVAGHDLSGLTIVTGRGATVSGRIVFDGTASRQGVQSPMRVSSAPADLSRPQLGAGSSAPNNGAADADGNFQLSGLTGRVFFNVPIPPAWMLKSVTLNGEDITDQPLDVTGRESVTGLQITLTDRVTQVSGVVTDDRGQPVTEATLVFLPAEQMDPLAASRRTRAIGSNSTSGRFQFRGLRPGRYVAAALDFLEQGRQFAPEFQERLRKGAREFTVREGEKITVDLKLTTGF